MALRRDLSCKKYLSGRGVLARERVAKTQQFLVPTDKILIVKELEAAGRKAANRVGDLALQMHQQM
jgi:hypothetical protein